MLQNASVLVFAVALTVPGLAWGQRAGRQTQQTPTTTSEAPSVIGKITVPVVGFSEFIEVILEQEGTGIPLVYTHVDSEGFYAFNGLRPDVYFIIVKLDGYEDLRERVDVRYMSPIMNFILTPKERDRMPKEAPVINAELRRKYPKKVIDEYDKAQDDNVNSNYSKAAERLVKVLKDAPDFFEAHSLLGTVYQKMQRYSDAELEYKKAHELNAKSVVPLLNLGTLYLQTAELSANLASGASTVIYGRAHDILLLATQVDARSATAFFLLGTACYKSALDQEAETSLKRALEIDNRMIGARLMLANVYVRQQKWQSALENLDVFLKENPNAPDLGPVRETRSKVAKKLDTK